MTTTGAFSEARVPEHLFDPRTQLRYIVWHDDPPLERLIRHAIDTVSPCAFIETGSHMGWTSMWVCRNYPALSVETVEVDPGFYEKARENLEQFPNARIVRGDSRDFVKDIVYDQLRDLEAVSPSVAGVPMFWLDAHWWPPVPLKDECAEVAKLPRYVCFIDDFSCWRPDFSGDTFFSIAPSSGDAYLNDISYVAAQMGTSYYRPIWEPRSGSKGVGLFIKGVDYVPPADLMVRESIDTFIELRAAAVEARKNEPGFVVYPLHPSSGRSA